MRLRGDDFQPLVAALSWRFLEQPINRFRSRATRAVLDPATFEEGEAPQRALVAHRVLRSEVT